MISVYPFILREPPVARITVIIFLVALFAALHVAFDSAHVVLQLYVRRMKTNTCIERADNLMNQIKAFINSIRPLPI